MKYQYGDPIADWKDESAYPDPTKMSGPELAWELIRRNPEYQNDFKRSKKKLTNKTQLELFNKWFGGASKGFLQMFDPKDDQPYAFSFFFKHAPYVFDCTGGKPGPFPGDYIVSRTMYKNDMGALFDLNMPIDPQIKIVKGYLQRFQKEKKIKPCWSAPNRPIHKLYWRVIDAKSSKAQPKEIRGVLKLNKNGGHDQFKECLKQALEWRDSKFRKLSSLE